MESWSYHEKQRIEEFTSKSPKEFPSKPSLYTFSVHILYETLKYGGFQSFAFSQRGRWNPKRILIQFAGSFENYILEKVRDSIVRVPIDWQFQSMVRNIRSSNSSSKNSLKYIPPAFLPGITRKNMQAANKYPPK